MNVGNIHESKEELHILETTPLSQTATITIRPGEASSAEMDSHPVSDQTVIVLEGELVAEVDGESEILRPGESLIIPAGKMHRLYNDAAENALAFTVFAPPAFEVEKPA
jgi:quercetin dioxygenase-like cupin family protein